MVDILIDLMSSPYGPATKVISHGQLRFMLSHATSPSDAEKVVPYIILPSIPVDQGTAKNGRAYTKHRIGWTGIDGKMIYGTTFSASDGDCACESMNLNCPCEITYVTGQYGLDIKSIKMSTMPMSATDYAGGEDEIPF